MVFFQFENFSLHVYRDFAGQVAAGNGSCNFSDVSDLGREVSGHGVDGVGQIFPGSGHTGHHCLTAKFSVRSHFAGHTCHFRSERTQLVHHRVDGFFQLQNFAAHIDRDFAGQIAAGHGGCDFCDISHLASKLLAIEFTESVKSFHVPATPGTMPVRRVFRQFPLRGPHASLRR